MISETGLEDAMLEIKEFTDRTTVEVNASLNETIQAARIPKVEQSKLGTTQETPIPCTDLQTRPIEETGIHAEI